MKWIFLIVILSAIVFASEPVLFFSDMTDGVISGWENSSSKGAAVSIWGLNFGDIRETSNITVCGVTLNQDSNFAEWGATTNPTTARGLERITFWLNSSMQIGSGTIKVATTEGESEEIPFYCRNTGNIYFLDNVNGNDSYDGLYSTYLEGNNGPKKTTGWARGNLEAGDVVYLKDSGIPYTDHDTGGSTYHYGGLFTFGGGTSPNHNNGVENRSITVTAYPGDNVKMEANVESGGVVLSSCIKMYYSGSQLSYWTFSKFTMEAAWATISLGGSGYVNGGISNVRIIGNDATTILTSTSQWGNIMVLYGNAHGMDHLHMYGNYLHDQCADFRGQDTGRRVYQVYIGGYGELDHLYIGWNEMGWGSQGRGFQVYGHTIEDSLDNLYVHDNYFHHDSRQCVILGGGDGGSAYSFIKNAYFYNNILAYPSDGDVAIFIGGEGYGKYGGNFSVYNNIFYRENGHPILGISDRMDFFYFKNNIMVALPNPWDYITYHPGTYDGFIENVITTSNYNLWSGAGDNQKPSWDSSTLDNIEPEFVDSNPLTYEDFRLLQTSPAIDNGTSDVSSVVTRDIVGTVRPQGEGYDIGAFEYTSDFHAADINEDGNISKSEMRTYINKWKTGEVMLSLVADAISIWKG